MLRILIAAVTIVAAASAGAADLNAAQAICAKHRLSSHPMRLQTGSAFEPGFDGKGANAVDCDAVSAELSKQQANSVAAKSASDASDQAAIKKALE